MIRCYYKENSALAMKRTVASAVVVVGLLGTASVLEAFVSPRPALASPCNGGFFLVRSYCYRWFDGSEISPYITYVVYPEGGSDVSGCRGGSICLYRNRGSWVGRGDAVFSNGITCLGRSSASRVVGFRVDEGFCFQN